MAAENLAVQLKLMADTAQFQAELRKAVSGLQDAGLVGKQSFDGANASAQSFRSTLRDLIGRFSAFWVAFKGLQGAGGTANIGIDFLSKMEDARLGMGALITAQAKLTDSTGQQLDAQESLNAAMAMSDEQIKKLRISGLQTAATTEQLVSAYQDAIGGGLRAGMSLDQIRELTVQTVQAAGAMGVPMNQLNQEIRSILDGTIDRNSRVAIRLGITNAEVTQWRNAGTLFTELNKRMNTFTEAGKASMNNWSTILSNIQEAGQILLGDMFKNPFGEMKKSLTEVLNTIIDVKTANISKEMANVVAMGQDIAKYFGQMVNTALQFTVKLIKDMADWWVENRAGVNGFIETVKGLVGGVLSVLWALITDLIKVFATMAAWLGTTSEGFRTIVIAVGIFIASMMAMNSISVASSALSTLTTVIAGLQTVMSYTAAFGAQGFIYSLTSLINPATLAVGAIAAVAGAVIYLAGAEERAHKARMEQNKASAEAVKNFQSMAKTYLEAYDAAKKTTKGTEDNKVALERLADARNALKLAYPELAKKLDDETLSRAESVKLLKEENAELLKQLRLKAIGLEQTLKAQELAQNEAIKKGPTVTNMVVSAVVGDKTGSLDYIRNITTLGEKAANTRKELQDLNEQIAALNKPIESPEVKLTPNKRQLTEQEINKALTRQKELREANQMVDDARLRTLERESIEEQKQLALEEERKKAQSEVDRIKGMKELNPAEKVARINQIMELSAQAQDRIIDKYDQKAEQAEEQLVEKLGIIGATGWDRKRQRMEKELNAAFDKAEKELGIVISKEERQSIIEQRATEERAQYRLNDMNRLEQAWEKHKQTTSLVTSYEEEIPLMQEWAQSMGFSAQAVEDFTTKLEENQMKRDDWFGGWQAGLQEFVNTSGNAFETFKNTATQMMSGVTNAFAQGIQGLITGQMSFKEAMNSIWKGLVQTIVQAVAQIIAKWIVMKIAQKLLGQSSAKAAAAEAAGFQISAAAQIMAAHAGIPFVGVPLALSFIAMMNAGLIANAAAAMAVSSSGEAAVGAGGGGSATVNADGGFYDRPTWGLFGEAGPELIAPETKFLDWTKNVTGNVQREMLSQGASMFQDAQLTSAPMPDSGRLMALQTGPITIMDSSRRGLRELGDTLFNALDAAAQERGYTIVTDRSYGSGS